MITEKNALFLVNNYQTILLEEKDSGNVLPKGICNTEDFLISLSEYVPQKTPILSNNVIAYKREISYQKLYHKYLYEVHPHVRQIGKDNDVGRISQYNFLCPYLYFIFNINSYNVIISCKLYASNTKIKSYNDMVYSSYFNNVDANGKICWGDDNTLSTNENHSESMSCAVNLFLDSPFNSDYGDVLSRRWPIGYNSITYKKLSNDVINQKLDPYTEVRKLKLKKPSKLEDVF